jgi:hypothetical protein
MIDTPNVLASPMAGGVFDELGMRLIFNELTVNREL